MEILITMSIITIMTSVSVSIYQKINSKNNLDVAVGTIVESIRYSKNQAQNQKDDSNWGVFLSNTEATVFSGDNYADRDSSNDRVFKLPRGLTVSDTTEIVFEKLTGKTLNEGNIIINNVYGEQILGINSYGMIAYGEVDLSGDPGGDPGDNPVFSTSVNVTGDYLTSYCADVTVSTDSTTPVIWNVNVLLDTYPTDGTPSSVWNAIWSFNSGVLTASGESYNETVVIGAPVVFGYCADRDTTPPSSDVFTNIVINSDWGSGYCANVTVSTDSTTPVAWNVDIPLDTYPIDGTPSSVWSSVWSFDAGVLTASGLSWNELIISGTNAEFGYCANR